MINTNSNTLDSENVVKDFQFKTRLQQDNEVFSESTSFFKESMKRFFKMKRTIMALAILLCITMFALVGPVISGYDYDEQKLAQQNMAPRIPGIEKLHIFDGSEIMSLFFNNTETNKYTSNKEFSKVYYWFGSDSLGRDLWTRTWKGTRISLYIALIAVLIDLLFGLAYGMLSGYLGGKPDFIMQRFIEIINAIPTLVIITLLLVIMKSGIVSVTLALIFSGWIRMSRVARAQVLKQKEQEYVFAAKTLGKGKLAIIFNEILPNIMGQIVTNTMFSVSDAIFLEAFLSFVGLGIQAPMASLGSLIADGYKNFMVHPYQIGAPVCVLVLLMLSFNILADDIRDAIDPQEMV